MQNHYPPPLSKSVIVACALFSCVGSSAYAAKEADWDKDGLSDKLEQQIGSEMYLADTDGDGIDDKTEFGNGKSPRDSDKDGRIDILDLDDDGDGIPSVVEGKSDVDKDGKANYLDTDSDGDALADGFEVRLAGKDTDEDGVDDLFDVDITKGVDENGDGIDDNITLVDSNQNGIPDITDKASTYPHIKKRTENKSAQELKAKLAKQAEEKQAKKEKAQKAKEKLENQAKSVKPVVVTAVPLPVPKKTEPRYTEKTTKDNTSAAYGGSGYFYCANTGKIVSGIKGFMMTPPGKVKLIRDASSGDYKWTADEPGIYAMQFQIPAGMSIVRGLAKGRRIVKGGDPDPLVLGGSENPGKKGYLMKPPGDASWYTSFEVKDDAPYIINNNIPLAGSMCK